MTRPSLIILPFLIWTTFAFGQQGGDTTISKQLLDSIKTENSRLKLYNSKLFYKNRLLSSLKSIDTAYPKSDSIVISYKSLDNLLLQRVIKKYRLPNCQAYETIEHFNDKGLVGFVEYWTCDCRSQKEVGEDEIVLEKILLHYERFLYDTKGKMILRVIWTSSTGTRKYEYKYDAYEKLTFKTTKISDNEFWD